MIYMVYDVCKAPTMIMCLGTFYRGHTATKPFSMLLNIVYATATYIDRKVMSRNITEDSLHSTESDSYRLYGKQYKRGNSLTDRCPPLSVVTRYCSLRYSLSMRVLSEAEQLHNLGDVTV